MVSLTEDVTELTVQLEHATKFAQNGEQRTALNATIGTLKKTVKSVEKKSKELDSANQALIEQKIQLEAEENKRIEGYKEKAESFDSITTSLKEALKEVKAMESNIERKFASRFDNLDSTLDKLVTTVQGNNAITPANLEKLSAPLTQSMTNMKLSNDIFMQSVQSQLDSLTVDSLGARIANNVKVDISASDIASSLATTLASNFDFSDILMQSVQSKLDSLTVDSLGAKIANNVKVNISASDIASILATTLASSFDGMIQTFLAGKISRLLDTMLASLKTTITQVATDLETTFRGLSQAGLAEATTSGVVAALGNTFVGDVRAGLAKGIASELKTSLNVTEFINLPDLVHLMEKSSLSSSLVELIESKLSPTSLAGAMEKLAELIGELFDSQDLTVKVGNVMASKFVGNTEDQNDIADRMAKALFKHLDSQMYLTSLQRMLTVPPPVIDAAAAKIIGQNVPAVPNQVFVDLRGVTKDLAAALMNEKLGVEIVDALVNRKDVYEDKSFIECLYNSINMEDLAERIVDKAQHIRR